MFHEFDRLSRFKTRPVDISSHQFFATGYFHGWYDDGGIHALIEDTNGCMTKYKMDVYTLTFKDRIEDYTQ